MKEMFSGYYTPTEDEFNTIWEECIFVFDTNTLLNLYRYSKDSRDTLFNVMETIKNRIWIPHQVALEYHKNMLEEIYNQKNAYNSIGLKVKHAVSSIEKDLKELRHSNINVKKLLEHLNEISNQIQDELDQQKESQPDLDKIKERINNLIQDRLGGEYTQKKIDEICKSGEERYKNEIPPGFKDLKEKANKITIHNGLKYMKEYGDLVYWNQILDKSKEESTKSIILITDDNKPDWVLEIKGEKKGPHPELIHEFKRISGGKLFYLYNTEQFLNYAKQYLEIEDKNVLNNEVIAKAIENVKETKKYLDELQGNNINVDAVDYIQKKHEIAKNSTLKIYYEAEIKYNGTFNLSFITDFFIRDLYLLFNLEAENVNSKYIDTKIHIDFTSNLLIPPSIIANKFNEINGEKGGRAINSQFKVLDITATI